jgi:hypothetical protein
VDDSALTGPPAAMESLAPPPQRSLAPALVTRDVAHEEPPRRVHMRWSSPRGDVEPPHRGSQRHEDATVYTGDTSQKRDSPVESPASCPTPHAAPCASHHPERARQTSRIVRAHPAPQEHRHIFHPRPTGHTRTPRQRVFRPHATAVEAVSTPPHRHARRQCAKATHAPHAGADTGWVGSMHGARRSIADLRGHWRKGVRSTSTMRTPLEVQLGRADERGGMERERHALRSIASSCV